MQPTIKIKELNIEIEKNVHDKNRYLDIDMETPYGWRLLNIEEVIYLANSGYAHDLRMDASGTEDDYFFFQQPFMPKYQDYKRNDRTARLGVYTNRLLAVYGWDCQYWNPWYGIRLCRELQNLYMNKGIKQ